MQARTKQHNQEGSQYYNIRALRVFFRLAHFSNFPLFFFFFRVEWMTFSEFWKKKVVLFLSVLPLRFLHHCMGLGCVKALRFAPTGFAGTKGGLDSTSVPCLKKPQGEGGNDGWHHRPLAPPEQRCRVALSNIPKAKVSPLSKLDAALRFRWEKCLLTTPIPGFDHQNLDAYFHTHRDSMVDVCSLNRERALGCAGYAKRFQSHAAGRCEPTASRGCLHLKFAEFWSSLWGAPQTIFLFNKFQ
jgi:hypothetical protein